MIEVLKQACKRRLAGIGRIARRGSVGVPHSVRDKSPSPAVRRHCQKGSRRVIKCVIATLQALQGSVGILTCKDLQGGAAV